VKFFKHQQNEKLLLIVLLNLFLNEADAQIKWPAITRQTKPWQDGGGGSAVEKPILRPNEIIPAGRIADWK
jgi:hypothetical protein